MNNSILSFMKEFKETKHFKKKLELVFYSILIGFFTGIVISFYRIFLDKVVVYRNQFLNRPILLFILIYLSSIICYMMLKHKKHISGSGIPQVMGLLKSKLKFSWFIELIYKFFGGIFAIFMGLSLGREGPSIHQGALIADGISKIFKKGELSRKYLITSGACAGLSAAFNAPLAGAVFALEELHKFFSPFLLICSIISSIFSNTVAQYLIGREVTFSNYSFLSPIKNEISSLIMQLLLILGLSFFVIVFSILFNKFLVFFQKLYAKKVNIYLKLLIVSIVSYLVVYFFPVISGGGHHLINELLITDFSLKLIVIIFILKFFFTMFSYSTGFPGGIFLPMLVLGALIGNIYGLIIVNIFNLDNSYVHLFTLLAMASYFSSIVKAPITGIILILEMTGNFSNLFSLIIASSLSYLISELLNEKSIYEILYENMFKENKEKNINFNRILVNITSNLTNKCIKDIKWPEDMLIIGIERSNNEIIPDGNTKLLHGDKLLILTNNADVEEFFSTNIKENFYEL